MNVKKLEEFGEGDLKLIKINYLIIIIITFVSVHVNATDPDAIKLNNEAVELIDSALKNRKSAKSSGIEGLKQQVDQSADRVDKNIETLEKFEKKSTFQKLLSLLFDGAPKLEEPPNDSGDNKSDVNVKELKPGEFLPGQDKKDQEENGQDVDESIVDQAHKKFLQSIMKSDELAEVRMNLGLSFELAGDKENSLKAYNMAEKVAKGNPSLEFIARYNKARLLAQDKKIPLALKEYQSALEINPESIEVKTNIELLMQQQQGGGKGGGEKKDNEGKGGQDPKGPIKKNPKNSEYKSQNLSKKNVEKILEELKNQEQKIREKEYNKGVKEKSRAKDW